MRIYFYRLSLTEYDQRGLFEEERPSRKDFLKKHFCDNFQINHWGKLTAEYRFTQYDDEIVAGAVCRWTSERRDDDPADPFATGEGGKWAKAAFFFNIEEHEQVFAIEHNRKVGSPSAIIDGIAKKINQDTGNFPYKIEAYELSKKGSFYDSVREYPGKITRISFKFVVPNPPNIEEETREALRKLGKSTGAETSSETLQSTQGLYTDSEYISDAVGYIEEGGGEATAKDGEHTVYKSAEVVRTETVDDSLRPSGSPISNLAATIKALLKKK